MRTKTAILIFSLVIISFIWVFTAQKSVAADSYVFVSSFGSHGSGNGQFEFPYSAATDAANNIYVADTYNHRIQKFDSSGAFITAWGIQGSADGEFDYPIGIAVQGNNVYVADDNNHRIQKFTTSGAFVTKWGSFGAADGQFFNPYGLTVDSAGNVYVADTFNQRIQKFNSSGAFITKWGTQGTGDGEFNNPVFIVVDSEDAVYVTDQDNDRVQKFTSSGTFVTKWGTTGTTDGQFMTPLGIAVDSSNNVFVVDQVNNHVEKYDSDGNYLNTKIGEQGAGDGQFDGPVGIAIDSDDNVYVVDTNNHRIQKFTLPSNPAPTFVSLSPRTVRQGETAEISIEGTNFEDAVTTVDFGQDITIDSLEIESATSMKVVITVGATAHTGLRNVIITNSEPGGGTATAPKAFNVQKNGTSGGGGYVPAPTGAIDPVPTPVSPNPNPLPPVSTPTVIPPVPECAPYLTRYLRYGDLGTEVIKLQNFLAREGSYPEKLVTGYFGQLTERAVKIFQTKYASDILAPQGLASPTGIERDFTQAKINALVCGGAVSM